MTAHNAIPKRVGKEYAIGYALCAGLTRLLNETARQQTADIFRIKLRAYLMQSAGG